MKSAADGKAVVAKMKEMPTDDALFGKGTIRADGRKVHDAYLYEVKKPEESKYPGDFYKVRATIPADRSVPAAQGRRLLAGERLTRQQAGKGRAAGPLRPVLPE